MQLDRLAPGYTVRVLGEGDMAQMLDLCHSNPQFYAHCPPWATRETLLEDMKALPPRTTYEDKFYFGVFDGEQLIAIVDLILNFPNSENAFVGFFMMHSDRQGKGEGSALVNTMLAELNRMGYRYTRLGYVKGNEQSRSFWHKNQFRETGVESVTEQYTIVLMQRENVPAI